MARRIIEILRISFEDSYKDDPSPLVVVYNPRILSFALSTQLMRFGLGSVADKKPTLSGTLKGSRKAFIELIQSYGLGVEIVPAA